MVSRNALRAAVLFAAAGVLASCSSSGPSVNFRTSANSREYFSERNYGAASPRVVSYYGAVPKGGGRSMVGEPYRVAGKTYIPTDNPRYSATGLASWYGDAFHGRLTANGEVYDVDGFTAAHPTLPLPSYARVTNLDNGRSMIVRVNDRGPFAADRIIDVSARVAGMLDFQNAGTARVKVDYMGPAQMDGLDQKQLLASYRDPGDGGTMFAFNRPPPADAPIAGSFVLASASAPRARPRVIDDFEQPTLAGAGPIVLVPAYAQDAAAAYDDPLAPLIMRTGFVNSYAPDVTLTGAQRAASGLAQASDLQAALARAAVRKAKQLGEPPVTGSIIQLGSFSDPANVERISRKFGRFGEISNFTEQSGDRTLTVVRVAVGPSVAPEMVVDAASQAGLTGAFVLTP